MLVSFPRGFNSGTGRNDGQHGARYRLPLRLRITALILLLVGTIALVLGSVVGRTSQDLVDATVEASLAASSDLALQELQRLRERTTAAADALAAHPIVHTTTRRERFERLSLLVTILKSVPGVSAVYVGWPNGDFVLLRPIGRHADRMRAPPAARWLVQWAGGEGARFDFLDGDLALVESRSELRIAFDPRLRPWFIEAGGTVEPILTAPYIFFTTREPGITAARKSRSGAIAGVDVALWELSARLPKGRPVPSAEAAVIDHRGGVVAYTDAARLQAVADRKTSDAYSLEAERLPTAKDVGSPVLEALAGKAGSMPLKYFGTLTIAGRDWLAAIVPLDQRGTIVIASANLARDGAAALGAGEIEPGDYVAVSVADTGVGMDKATAERAFEPFFTTKGIGKGTGLGLSIVYGFAKQSKGLARIESAPGRGTTVLLYLPRAGEGAPADTGEAKPRERPARKGSERVLLVDDDDLVREHVRAMLADLGYGVHAVPTAPEALEALAGAGPFDLLLTDVAMPGGMSGIELARSARKTWPALPVILTSGYAGETDAVFGADVPGAHALHKPFRREDLAAKVRAALD